MKCHPIKEILNHLIKENAVYFRACYALPSLKGIEQRIDLSYNQQTTMYTELREKRSFRLRITDNQLTFVLQSNSAV